MLRALAFLSVMAALLGAAACASQSRYDQAIGVLIDVSGTYADQKAETVQLIKRDILPHMIPGDTLIVIRIDSESYDRTNVEALLTLDSRPSHANAQKLALSQQLDAFVKRPENASHTDIPGAIMLASEYLREISAGSSAIVLFSDMQEDLPKGTKRALAPDELQNTHVVAMNVKRLHRDTQNPEVFRRRLATWEERLTKAGALEWRSFMDAEKLPEFLSKIRA
jgi:hypothetical protein